MKRATSIAACLIAAFALAIVHTGCDKTPSVTELKTYLEVTEMKTKWVDKYYQPWPQKLKLVPVISFRVKNISGRTLRHVYFNAIFREKGEAENLGDDLLAAFGKKPLLPGEVSDEIVMKSNFGVEGKNLAHFKNNPAWKPVTLKLFIKIKGSRYALLGEWDVSQEIDFEEPEPVGAYKTEKKDMD